MSFFESFRAARWIRTTNLVLQAILIVTLFGGLNYLALHFAWRFDLTNLRSHSLSAETLSYIEHLSRPVHIVVTINKDPNDAALSEAYGDVTEMLREYAFATQSRPAGKITFSTLDVLQRPGEARQLGADENLVMVLSKDKRRILHLTDLYLMEKHERKSFIGEQAITSAILDVTNEKPKKIYFLAGHGEMDPSSVAAATGLSLLTDELGFRNFEIDRLELAVKNKIPEDASLLIIAGPQSAYQPMEQELLRQYMSVQAGRMLILIAPSTEPGLNGLISDDWGILIRDAIIRDDGPTAQNDAGVLILKKFAPDHEITKVLLSNNLPVQFALTRSVQVNPSRASDEGLSVKRLIAPSNTSWGETNINEHPPVRDAADIPAEALGAAIASERVGATADLRFSVPRGRLVVFGCADFISNGGISRAGNLNLALSSINWLVDRDAQLNIPVRPIEKFQLALSQQELWRLRNSLLFALPAAAALLGLIVYWTRRR